MRRSNLPARTPIFSHACRDRRKGEEAMAKLREEAPGARTESVLDLASLLVHAFASESRSAIARSMC
jgi:hypothetical protein